MHRNQFTAETTKLSVLLACILLVMSACQSKSNEMPTLAVLPSSSNLQTTASPLATIEGELDLTEPSLPPLVTSINNPSTSRINIPETVESAVPHQFVLQFEASATVEEQEAYIESINGQVVSSIEVLNTLVISLPSSSDVSALPQTSIIMLDEPDYYASAQQTYPSNDQLTDQQWALEALNIGAIWESLPDDLPTLTVAVIDSGVCLDHEDMQGRIEAGWDFIDNDEIAQDDFGHGCGVAGVIASNANNTIGIAGIAPNTQIMPLRVLNESGIGTYSDIAAAIVWATDHGASIINLSLGGLNSSTTLKNAINYALSHGLVVVAAAGNTGDHVLYPAAYDSVIAVGSVDQNLEISSFSSRGSQIDLLAPGRDILTTANDNNYITRSGTSFSAPYVTGVAAIRLALGQSIVQDGGFASFDQLADDAISSEQTVSPDSSDLDEGETGQSSVDSLSVDDVRLNEIVQTIFLSGKRIQYIELSGVSGTVLDDLTLISMRSSGLILHTVNFSATDIIPADGIFVATNSDTENYYGVIKDSNFSNNFFAILSPTTFLLVKNYNDDCGACDFDTNNDGLIDAPAWDQIVDDVGFGFIGNSYDLYSTNIVPAPLGSLQTTAAELCEGGWQAHLNENITDGSPGTVNVCADKGVEITGYVSVSSTSLTNVQMYVDGVENACTDVKGNYRIAELVSGTNYTISTRGEHCGPYYDKNFFEASTIVAAPAVDIDFSLSPQTNVFGFIHDDNGIIIDNIGVTVTDGADFSATVCTDEVGFFRINESENNIPSSYLTLTVGGLGAGSACSNSDHDTYELFSQAIDLVSNTMIEVDIELSIPCTVYDSNLPTGYTLGTVSSNLQDDLWQAIECANQTTSDDIIDLNNQTIIFDYAPPNYDADGFNALPPISPTSTAGRLIIQNGTIERDSALTQCKQDFKERTQFRLFQINEDADLTLQNVNLRNGCSDDVVNGPIHDELGGAIYNRGQLSLIMSSISGSEAGKYGGGIYNAGILIMDSSTISNNTAESGGGGGVYSFGSVSMENSTLIENFTRSNGGGLWTIGTANLSQMLIRDNEANYGSGLANKGTLSIDTTIFLDNVGELGSGGGGAILNENILTLNSSTFLNNRGRRGNGIYNNGGTLTVTNSSFQSNWYNEYGGGIINLGSGIVNITNSTFGVHSSSVGDSLLNLEGSMILSNSIVADGVGTWACANYDELIYAGLNIIEDGTCGASAKSQLTGDPLLDPNGLQDNGGFTQTIATLLGSRAINRGINSEAIGLDFDQRGIGYSRIIGQQVDIGAYEAGLDLLCIPYVDLVTGYTVGTVTTDLEADLQQAVECANFLSSNDIIDLDGATVTYLDAPAIYDLEGHNALQPITSTSIAGTLTIQNGTIERDDNLVCDIAESYDEFRFFTLYPSADLSLFDLTLINGCSYDYDPPAVQWDGYGGAILNQYANLTIEQVTILDSQAEYQGGAIFIVGGTGTNIDNSTFINNEANYGGAVSTVGATATITGSSFVDNIASYGGAVQGMNASVMTIANSTLADNIATQSGGGVHYDQSNVTINNSTITNNEAGSEGAGGVYVTYSDLTINNSTLSANLASQIADSLYVHYSNTQVANTIIANDLLPSCLRTNGSISFNAVNLIEDASCNAVAIGQLTGDPLLDPSGLQDNGGQTQTIALMDGSPAIDAGDSNVIPVGLDFDQRGVGFPRIQGSTVDLGAYETVADLICTPYDASLTTGYTVGTVNTNLEADLRQAIECANASTTDDTIDLDGVTLTYLDAPVSYDLEGHNALQPITATSIAGTLTIQNGTIKRDESLVCDSVTDSPDEFRFLYLRDGSDLTLYNVRLENGCAVRSTNDGYGLDTFGGAIYSEGVLYLDSSTLTNNIAQSDESQSLGGLGGAIYGKGGTITITNSILDSNLADTGGALYTGGIDSNVDVTIVQSTVSGNSAKFAGGVYVGNSDLTVSHSSFTNNTSTSLSGAIHTEYADNVTIINSTFYNNSATALAGAIHIFATQAMIANTTFSNNPSDQAEAIYVLQSPLTLVNSILADDINGILCSSNVAGLVTYAGMNLIEDGSCNAVANDQLTGDPLLGTLQDNGGTTQTIALLSGSPAINAGDNSQIPAGITNDQRGVGYPRVLDAAVDLGAYESEGSVLPTYTPFPPNTPAPTATIPTATPTVFRCDYLFVNFRSVPFSANRVYIEITNYNEQDAFLLESEIHWDKSAVEGDFPNIYFATMALDDNAYWAGSDTTSPTIAGSEGTLFYDPDARDHLIFAPADGETIYWQGQFLNSPQFLSSYFDISDFLGTQFLFDNPESSIDCLVAAGVIIAPTDIPTEGPSPTATPTLPPTYTNTPTPIPTNTPSPSPTPTHTLPLSLTAVPVPLANDIKLSWQIVPNETLGFVINRSPLGANSWTAVGTVASGVMEFIDESTQCDTDYDYRVKTNRFDTNWAYTSATSWCEPDSITNSTFTDTDNTLRDSSYLPSVICGTTINHASVWEYTATQNMVWNLNSFGSNFDTVLSIFTYENEVFSPIACNDDSATNLTSALTASLTSGTDYIIVVGGKNGADGTIQLNGYEAIPATATAIPSATAIPIATNEPRQTTVGLFKDGLWFFRDSNSTGHADVTIRFGTNLGTGWQPLVGDWDGDGTDGIGLYKDGRWVLRDLASGNSSADYSFRFGSNEAGWQAIVGDWDGDGRDGIGLYKDGLWTLKNDLSSSKVDYTFRFNPTGENTAIAIAGDWHNDALDHVGLYDGRMWYLSYSHLNSNDAKIFQFGLDSSWQPVVGDWDKDGDDTIGVYKDSGWRLRNTNSRGNPDLGMTFGVQGAIPITAYRGDTSALLAFASMSEPSGIIEESRPISPSELVEEGSSTPTSMPTFTLTPAEQFTATPTPTLTIAPVEEFTAIPSPTLTLMPTMTETSTWTPAPTLTPSEVPPVIPENVTGT